MRVKGQCLLSEGVGDAAVDRVRRVEGRGVAVAREEEAARLDVGRQQVHVAPPGDEAHC